MGAAVPQELIATNVSAAKLLAEEPPESPSRSAQLGSVGDGFEAAEAPDHGSEAVQVEDKQDAANPAAGYQILEAEQEVSNEAAGSTGESKGPVIGGPSPSEASSVWPEDVGSGPKTAAAPQIQTFSVYYLVKFPRRPANVTDLAAADSQLRDKTDKRDKISEAFQKKRAEKFEIIEKLKEKRTTLRSCIDAAKQKGDELSRVQQELDGMKGDPKYCRSEKELDARIRQLDDVLQHESLDIKEERQIVRQIKELRATRGKVQENEHAYGDSRRDELAERKDHLQKEVKELRERRTAAYSSVAVLEEELKAVNAVLDDLSRQREVAEDARNGLYEKRRNLNEQQFAANDDFFQNRRDIALARQYGASGQKAALEEFASRQVEHFMEKWNNDPEFRADYMKNNEQSTLRRFRTLDGRLLGPDERPVSLPDSSVEASKPSNAPQPPVKRQEEIAPVPAVEAKPRQKVVEDMPPAVAPEPVKKGPEDEEAEALAQERRRQEEMEKRKEAEARKKKIAERKQAKAELRSQREALEKEKKKQKKIQKKAGSSEETSNEDAEGAEVNGVQENGILHQEETAAAAAPAPKATSRAAVRPVFKPQTRARALPRRRRPQTWVEWLQDLKVVSAIVLALVAVMAVVVYVTLRRRAPAVTQ